METASSSGRRGHLTASEEEGEDESNLSLECALQRLAEATLSETEDSLAAPNVVESLRRLEKEAKSKKESSVRPPSGIKGKPAIINAA